jgi:hypothetical protein
MNTPCNPSIYHTSQHAVLDVRASDLLMLSTSDCCCALTAGYSTAQLSCSRWVGQ